MARPSCGLLDDAVDDVMGHERFAVVLANMAVDVEPGHAAQIPVELSGIVVLDDDRPLGAGQRVGHRLGVERNDPFDRQVVGGDTLPIQ